jgi:DNA-binding ferritin-like protein
MKPPTIDRLMKRLEELAERLTAIGRLTKRLQELTEQRNIKEHRLQAVLERLQAKNRGLRSGVRMLNDAHGEALGWNDNPPEVKQPEPSPKEPS